MVWALPDWNVNTETRTSTNHTSRTLRGHFCSGLPFLKKAESLHVSRGVWMKRDMVRLKLFGCGSLGDWLENNPLPWTRPLYTPLPPFCSLSLSPWAKPIYLNEQQWHAKISARPERTLWGWTDGTSRTIATERETVLQAAPIVFEWLHRTTRPFWNLIGPLDLASTPVVSRSSREQFHGRSRRGMSTVLPSPRAEELGGATHERSFSRCYSPVEAAWNSSARLWSRIRSSSCLPNRWVAPLLWTATDPKSSSLVGVGRWHWKTSTPPAVHPFLRLDESTLLSGSQSGRAELEAHHTRQDHPNQRAIPCSDLGRRLL